MFISFLALNNGNVSVFFLLARTHLFFLLNMFKKHYLLQFSISDLLHEGSAAVRNLVDLKSKCKASFDLIRRLRSFI